MPKPFCRALPTPQQRSPSPLPRSLIGGEIFIVEVSFVVGGFGGGARGKGRGARGEGQGAGAGHCACVVLFFFRLGKAASFICCPFSHAPPCCRNPIHVNQPCLALLISRRLHFAASSQWVCAAPLGCCRESGVGFLCLHVPSPPPLFCERLFADL